MPKQQREELLTEEEIKCVSILQCFGCVCCLCTLCASWIPFCCYTHSLADRIDRRIQEVVREEEATQFNSLGDENNGDDQVYRGEENDAELQQIHTKTGLPDDEKVTKSVDVLPIASDTNDDGTNREKKEAHEAFAPPATMDIGEAEGHERTSSAAVEAEGESADEPINGV